MPQFLDQLYQMIKTGRKNPLDNHLTSVLQCSAVCCSFLQCVVVCCVWIRTSSLLSSSIVAVCCSVLQCVAVCCSVLQCVAVCCSVLYVD